MVKLKAETMHFTYFKIIVNVWDGLIDSFPLIYIISNNGMFMSPVKLYNNRREGRKHSITVQ